MDRRSRRKIFTLASGANGDRTMIGDTVATSFALGLSKYEKIIRGKASGITLNQLTLNSLQDCGVALQQFNIDINPEVEDNVIFFV